MHLIPWLDPAFLIEGFGAYALLGVCIIIFAANRLINFTIAIIIFTTVIIIMNLHLQLVCLCIFQS